MANKRLYEKHKYLAVYVDLEVWQKIQAQAQKLDTTVSKLVNQILADHISKEDQREKGKAQSPGRLRTSQGQ